MTRSSDNEYKLGSAMGFGFGMTWFGGTGTYTVPTGNSAAASLEVQSNWYFGAASSAGLRSDLFEPDGGVGGSLNIGVFAGLKDFGFTVGYDFMGKVSYVGIAAKIDVFSLKRGTGSDVCVKREAW
jgi:hypothetical protein